jgi:hypothetical protein
LGNHPISSTHHRLDPASLIAGTPSIGESMETIVGRKTREAKGYLVASVDVPKILVAFEQSTDGKVRMVNMPLENDVFDRSGFFSVNGQPYTNQFNNYEATFLRLALPDETDEDAEEEDYEIVTVEPHELQVYSEEHLFDESDFYSYDNDGYEDQIAELLAEGGQLKPLKSYRLLVWRGKIRSFAQYLKDEEIKLLPLKEDA